jgi:hypothetical protein
MDIRTSLAAMALAALTFPGLAQSPLTVTFADPAWTGDKVPAGQHCPLQGGTGATPALTVAGIPDGTRQITVAFNDETYQPMNDGGHGVIGFEVAATGGEATLPSVPGNTLELPSGAYIVTAARGTGEYASPGYLPPCSGGAGNTYTATVNALDSTGAMLASGKITLGKY